MERRDPGNSGRSSREALTLRNRPRFQATFCFFLFSHTFWMYGGRDPGNSGRSCQGGVRVSWISRYSCFSHTFWKGKTESSRRSRALSPLPDLTVRDFPLPPIPHTQNVWVMEGNGKSRALPPFRDTTSLNFPLASIFPFSPYIFSMVFGKM